jgi:hypothetical protein
MNTLTRLMLCVAILAGGVMVGSRAGGPGSGGGVSTYPNHLFEAIIKEMPYDYIAHYLQTHPDAVTWELNSMYNGKTPLDYARERTDGGVQIAELLIQWGAQDPQAQSSGYYDPGY